MNLERVFDDCLPNLIDMSMVGKPSEASRASCAGLCLVFGLWHLMNDRGLVFPREDLLKLAAPYNVPAHKINADKFREAIEANLPTLSAALAGQVLIEAKALWTRNRKSGPKLNAFEEQKEKILRETDNAHSIVKTVDLFNFLFELATPIQRTA